MNETIRHPLRSPLARFAVAAVLVTGAAATTVAFAHGGPGGEGRMGHGGPMAMHAGMGPGGHGGHGGPGGGMWMGRGLDRLLDDVKATEDQRTRIRGIAEAARRDLQAQHGGHQALRDQTLSALSQPNVDAAQVEAVRRQMLAQHDAATQRMSRALVEIAQVLTPEQRTQLAQRMKDRGERMRRGHDHGPGTGTGSPQRPANPAS